MTTYRWRWTPEEGSAENPVVEHGQCIEWWDGPQIEVAKLNDVMHLACLVDDRIDQRQLRWLMVPIDEQVLKTLCDGDLPLREAFLRHSEVVLIDMSYMGEVVRTWRVPSLSVPDDYLPTEGISLSPRDLPIFPDDNTEAG